MSHDYKQDYEVLGLEAHETWAVAQQRYRRLVNKWHPDRYTNRPREKNHAQSQFIELTRAFDSLRSFQRENGRLPLEPFYKPKTGEAAESDNNHTPNVHSDPQKGKRASAQNEQPSVVTEPLTQRGKSGKTHSGKHPMRALLWLAPAMLLVIATLALFAVLESREQAARQEEKRAATSDPEPSEFYKDNARIRVQNAKRAIIRDN